MEKFCMGFKDLTDISELENLCTFNWGLTGSGKTSFIDDCFVLNLWLVH
jgi:hypothetical protein